MRITQSIFAVTLFSLASVVVAEGAPAQPAPLAAASPVSTADPNAEEEGGTGNVEKNVVTPEIVKCDGDFKAIKDVPSRLTGEEKDFQPPYNIQLPAGYNTVKITEVARKSRLQEDLDALFDRKAMPAQPLCFYYTPKYKRANVTVEYSKNGESAKSKKIVTGPVEHWYLGADLPVTDIKQLTFDPATNTVKEKEKPTTFYGSVNYRIGDLQSGYDRESLLNNVSVKLMAQASEHPNESMGVGLGYSFGGALEIFVAHLWTKDEEEAYTSDPGTTESTAFGLTFNIAKGIEWFSGE
jgi:hypothetical protein